jgi:hypothetical protein
LGSRFNGFPNDGDQTVQALLDGNIVGTWVLTTGTPFSLETAVFTGTTNGGETLEFRGVSSGDHTAFVSHVSIATVPEPASFALLAIGLGAIVGRRRLSGK